MCGITGWFNRTAKKQTSILSEMCSLIAHRGPNCSFQKVFDNGEERPGEKNEGTIGLGHTRLSIIDLSSDGNQPMSDNSSRYWIVFNGEIYNYRELKKNLLSHHIKFKGNSDTEVLLYLYILKKEKCVSELNGIFAFAIVDLDNNEMFLARDRLGVKPLYFYYAHDQFVFGSELKPIYRYLTDRFEINNDAIVEFFKKGYIGDNRTIAKNIFKLPPAAWIKINHEGDMVCKKYWEVDLKRVTKMQAMENYTSEGKILQNVKNTIQAAVRRQLVSDVPLGTFLSGGIDSSLVSAFAAKEVAGQLNTFSIGFNEPEFDESGFAKTIARHLGAKHHELILGENDFLKLIETLPEMFDEPFADSSAIPTLALARFTREKITVALSGDGGDEQFWGYTRYDHMKKIAALYRVPSMLRRLFSSLILPEIFGMDLSHKIKILAYENKYIANDNLSNSLLSLRKSYNGIAEFDTSPNDAMKSLGFENFLMIKDLCDYMIDDVLAKVDRASMHCGLEVRVPLLDHIVIENSFYEVPLFYKTNFSKKYILKTILKDFIPESLFERPKMGFGIPLQKWVNNDLYPAIEAKLMEKSVLDVFFNKKNLKKAFYNEKIVNTKFGAEFFWRVFMFLSWENRYMKADFQRLCKH
jgi:asparagine synthase (glutamine-hydrolysing)